MALFLKAQEKHFEATLIGTVTQQEVRTLLEALHAGQSGLVKFRQNVELPKAVHCPALGSRLNAPLAFLGNDVASFGTARMFANLIGLEFRYNVFGSRETALGWLGLGRV